VLDFRNPIFHPGLNLTVRVGDEFLDHPTVRPGVTVTLTCSERGIECGPALIVTIEHYGAVAAFPRDVLRF
jgi:hypothetical protein